MARLSSTLYGGLLPDGNVNQELVKQSWYIGGIGSMHLGIENDADSRGSLAAVERSMSDRLLEAASLRRSHEIAIQDCHSLGEPTG